MTMKRKKRYINFYKFHYNNLMPYVEEYGFMCTRTYWECLKIGFRHIRKGKATFFIIEKAKPKKNSNKE